MNKRTSAITLLLVGAFVVGCDGDERHRAFYQSKEDCLKDWGTESSCQQSEHNGGVYYFGPWYSHSSAFWGRGGGAAAGIVGQGGGSISSSSEHFGGFGESASAHGGVGE